MNFSISKYHLIEIIHSPNSFTYDTVENCRSESTYNLGDVIIFSVYFRKYDHCEDLGIKTSFLLGKLTPVEQKNTVILYYRKRKKKKKQEKKQEKIDLKKS